MNTVLFVNATIGFSENIFLVIDVCVCVCVCVCFRARILTFYILAMTNPKMAIIQRLLATMS